MNTTYLLLGSNMGTSLQQLATATLHIGRSVGPVVKQSALYATKAWGKTDQPDFLNQALMVNTLLSAPETLRQLLVIEEEMGRKRTTKNAPRIIDIDILFFNQEVIQEPNLVVPHPEIQNRRFVLVPMTEIAGTLLHPLLHKTVAELLEECPDLLAVKKF